jgi:hypothetical protein
VPSDIVGRLFYVQEKLLFFWNDIFIASNFEITLNKTYDNIITFENAMNIAHDSFITFKNKLYTNETIMSKHSLTAMNCS